MSTWRMGSAAVAAGVGMAILATMAPAAAHVQASAGTQPAKRLQVQVTVLSAGGTVTTAVQGTYDHQYIYVEDPNTGELKRATTASMNSTVTWKAPKQELAGMVFGAGDCDDTRVGCSIPIHKVTGTAQGTASASYADGTTKSCPISLSSLTSGSTDLFSDSQDTLGVKMLGVGGKKVKIWLGGAYPIYGMDAEECPGMSGLKFTENRDVAPTIPMAKLTGAKIGKPFTLAFTSVAPINGKTGDAVSQVGTVTQTTTLKVKVTAKF